MNSDYLVNEFVNVKVGDAYRLFAFGKVHKGGKIRDITPEFAANCKLPMFKPPVKLGSHDDTTPAGGHMVSLEVRGDGNCPKCKEHTCKEHGLFVTPEWNDKGTQSLQDGAYRYHSPEIIFEGGIEDPQTGDIIRAPVIVGDALLHTPHLGEDTAFYESEPITKEINNMENVSVPASLWDKFTAFLDSKLTPAEPLKVEVIPEDYTAIKRENAEFKAKQTEKEVADKFTATKSEIVAQLQKKEDYGMSYVELKAADEAATVLAGMSDQQRDWVMRNFRALIVQVKTSALLGEQGSEGTSIDDPKAAFNALVLKYSADHKINYNSAFEIVKAENVELFTAWAVGGK